ncbi:hypothetical protein N9W78_00115 [bacterium]|nr:hypothetical protein [bacterium]
MSKAGKAVLMQALEPVPLELMRLLLTEARRFPDLGQSIDQMARDQVVDIVAYSIKTGRPEKTHENENKPSPQDIAERFLDLTFSPILLAVLTGQESRTSTDAIDQRINVALDVLEQLGFLDEGLH